MNVHFIAIGGSAMHNLALALHKKGYTVTGSDDEIFEPARGRLSKYGLLPGTTGWFPEKIHPGLDAVILGMHARADNPELLKAKQAGIKIYSYPEFLYEQSKNKKRIVIGGSHGKTTITAMILHALKANGMDTDFMVGAQLEGFDVMVKLTEAAPYMIFEGDEYLTSPVDRRPKFHLYHPDIALLSGIAWDHINVFPTFGNYIQQFSRFISMISPEGVLIYCSEDAELVKISKDAREDIKLIPYSFPEHRVADGITYIKRPDEEIAMKIFGKHNLLNLDGARLVCNRLGLDDTKFYRALQSFTGASKRLELVATGRTVSVFKDFAHSPSKLEATVSAVREQFPHRKLVACMELHTFSSLSKEFLPHYKGSMDKADIPIVYYNPHAIQLKKLPPVSPEQIREGFDNPRMEIFSDSALLCQRLLKEKWENSNLLMMSSGDFDGMDLPLLAKIITGKPVS